MGCPRSSRQTKHPEKALSQLFGILRRNLYVQKNDELVETDERLEQNGLQEMIRKIHILDAHFDKFKNMGA